MCKVGINWKADSSEPVGEMLVLCIAEGMDEAPHGRVVLALEPPKRLDIKRWMGLTSKKLIFIQLGFFSFLVKFSIQMAVFGNENISEHLAFSFSRSFS